MQGPSKYFEENKDAKKQLFIQHFFYFVIYLL